MYKNCRNPFMINILDSFFADEFFNTDITKTSSINYDITEDDKNYNINFMLAGFNKKDVSINVEKETLTIKGERPAQEKTKYNRKGSFFGKFEKSFALPEDILGEDIMASFNDGVLLITIPKDVEIELSKEIIIS